MVSMAAQASYGAILTSQKSPALSAVRQENKSQAWHQNPAGRQSRLEYIQLAWRAPQGQKL